MESATTQECTPYFFFRVVRYFAVSFPSGRLIPSRTSVLLNLAGDIARSFLTDAPNFRPTISCLLVLAVPAITADPPDREDVLRLSDADLDVRLFINPTPLPSSFR